MNRYQNNITPGAFNLGMGAQQTQRPDMTAPNLRPNIGNPHHVSTMKPYSSHRIATFSELQSVWKIAITITSLIDEAHGRESFWI